MLMGQRWQPEPSMLSAFLPSGSPAPPQWLQSLMDLQGRENLGEFQVLLTRLRKCPAPLKGDPSVQRSLAPQRMTGHGSSWWGQLTPSSDQQQLSCPQGTWSIGVQGGGVA